jgi:hypothetical protein
MSETLLDIGRQLSVVGVYSFNLDYRPTGAIFATAAWRRFANTRD